MIFIFVLGVSYFYNKHSCLNHWIEFLQRPPNQCEEYLEDVISYLESMADLIEAFYLKQVFQLRSVSIYKKIGSL